MSRPTRKRQQRLAFTPIPSSSPAAKGYHKQIQDRAAAVTLQGSPGSSSNMRKPRKAAQEVVVDLVSDDDEVLVPSPAASPTKSNRGAQDSGSESEPVRLRSNLKRPKQQRLDFSNVRDPSSFDSPIPVRSSTRTRSSATAGMFSSQIQARLPNDSDESDNEDLPSPGKLLKARKNAKTSSKSSKGKGKAAQKEATRVITAAEEEDVGDDQDEIIVASSRRRDVPPQQPMEDSDDDTDMPTTQRRRRLKPHHTKSGPSSSPVRVDGESDDEDTDMPTTQGKQPRKRARRNSFISDSPPPADSDDDLVILPSRKRARIESDEDGDEEDDDEDALPKTPGRRGLKRTRHLSQREQEDLNEDLDFFAPSDDAPSSGRKYRSSQSAQKTAKQQALERLKRKRAGQEVPEELQEDQGDREGQDDAEEDGSLGDEEEDDYVDEETGAVYTSSRQFFEKRDEDDEFVEEEEDDGPLGVPAGIPLEFTRYASLKPKELFKYAVDWMVQKSLNPSFDKHDPLYNLTFRKLNDEAQGLAGSKFKSSAWTAAFRYALEARPLMEVDELDGNEMADHEKCDACNRSSHQCTFKVRFYGKPYQTDTLEDVASDDDDSDSDDDEDSNDEGKVEYNAQGLKIANPDHYFYIGKFCKGNAATSHALQHWRYHLDDYVQDYLRTAGYFKSGAVQKRARWSTKKLRKYANKVVESMEREGEILSLWKLFRDNIDQARFAKAGGRFREQSP